MTFNKERFLGDQITEETQEVTMEEWGTVTLRKWGGSVRSEWEYYVSTQQDAQQRCRNIAKVVAKAIQLSVIDPGKKTLIFTPSDIDRLAACPTQTLEGLYDHIAKWNGLLSTAVEDEVKN